MLVKRNNGQCISVVLQQNVERSIFVDSAGPCFITWYIDYIYSTLPRHSKTCSNHGFEQLNLSVQFMICG